MKILVVEDELYAREALIRQIQQYDQDGHFRILEAANGEEGLNIFRAERPEFLMTDIRMPRMDGLKLLEKVREINEKVPVIILSAYSDFEYARTALSFGASEYLLKPIDSDALEKCLDKFVQQHHREKEEELITGKDMITRFLLNSVRREKTAGFVEKSMFEKLFPSYQIVVVFFRNGKPRQEEFLENIQKLYGNAFWTKFRFLELEEELWLMLISAEQDTAFLWRKIRKMLEQQGFEAWLGVSRTHVSAGEVIRAYQEARDVLKHKIYGRDTLLLAEKIEEESCKEYYLKSDRENQLRTALADGNKKKAVSAVKKCFEEIRYIEPVKMECLELLYSHLILFCRQGIGVEEQSRKISRFPEGILKFASIDEMESYLCRIAEEICRLKKSESSRSSGEIVEFMAEYARQHYYEDVTVKEIAEKILFMNQDYISHLFAERKGVNFSSFLKKVRIDYAKEILKDGRNSVTDTASMVGYNDVSQFIRIFKQETGMTPKKYCSRLAERGSTDESGDRPVD